MSEWKVRQEDATLPHNHLEALVQRVVDDDDPPMIAQQSAPVMLYAPGVAPNPYAASPQPLSVLELQHTPRKESTPVVDPMESFNNWVRQQTPNHQATPTPPRAAYIPPPNSAGSPPGAQHYTPQKYTLMSNQTSIAALADNGLTPSVESSPMRADADAHHTTPLEELYEHRRALMQQMEDLAQQEIELRMPLPTSQYEATQHPYTGQPLNAVDNIRGRVYETAKDQHGCRYLQRLLDQSFVEAAEAAQVILSEIVPHIPELMTDQYANFLVQKLFDMMPHEVRYAVASITAPHITHIALTAHGTFSVQKMIETIATREEMELIKEALIPEVVRLVKDVHGNHVIQKVLQRFDHPDKQFIYDALTNECVAISTNKQGCCVLQRCLEYASPPQRQQLVRAVVANALLLVQDPFGNYVVQYVLDANEVPTNDSIAMAFLPQLVLLCMNKFSSNVVEKALRSCSSQVKDNYVQHLKDTNTVAQLIQDDYGNYVVQTALSVASASQAEMLVSTVRPLMHLIRNAPYAKKLEAKLELCLKKKSSQSRGPRHHSDQQLQTSPTGRGSSSNSGSPQGNGYRNSSRSSPTWSQ